MGTLATHGTLHPEVSKTGDPGLHFMDGGKIKHREVK